MIAKLWSAAREFAARLFRRKPVEPGHFVADRKLAWRGWLAAFGAVPAAATAPALVVVGGLMLSSIGEIRWDDVCVAFPAFLSDDLGFPVRLQPRARLHSSTLVMIPLTFSIANGLAFGLTSYVLIHLARGRGREVPKAAYPLAVVLLIRFIYMGSRL